MCQGSRGYRFRGYRFKGLFPHLISLHVGESRIDPNTGYGEGTSRQICISGDVGSAFIADEPSFAGRGILQHFRKSPPFAKRETGDFIRVGQGRVASAFIADEPSLIRLELS